MAQTPAARAFSFHPTSASWLNLVERFFSELTTRQLRRPVVTSVHELEIAIDIYIAHGNVDPTPFTWTASVRKILAKAKEAPRQQNLWVASGSGRRPRS